MARIRTIKPEFWESETVAELSLQARLTFIACLNLADDEGRMRWNAAHVKAFAFPYDDDVFTESVSEWLTELVTARLIEPYTASSGNRSKQVRYAQVCGFKEHQKVNRPSPSKYPAPPPKNSGIPSDLPDEHGLTESFSEDSVNDSLLEGKGMEGKGMEDNAANESPPPPKPPRNGNPPEFESWWESYPKNAKGRKRGKQTCLGLWKRIPADDRSNLMTATKHYATEETEFIRDPERFLKSDWWRDWIEPPDKSQPRQQLIEGIGIEAYNAGWDPEREDLGEFLKKHPEIEKDHGSTV